jgi:hypothetical protein
MLPASTIVNGRTAEEDGSSIIANDSVGCETGISIWFVRGYILCMVMVMVMFIISGRRGETMGRVGAHDSVSALIDED